MNSNNMKLRFLDEFIFINGQQIYFYYYQNAKNSAEFLTEFL